MDRIFCFCSEDKLLSLQDVVRAHVDLVMNSDPEHKNNLINMRQKLCWKDALSKLSKPSFIPERKLSVRFANDLGTSEGAVDRVDQGGPTREFLRLAVHAMFETSGMFGGGDKNRGVVLNSQCMMCSNFLFLQFTFFNYGNTTLSKSK